MLISIIIPTKDRLDIFMQTLEKVVAACKHIQAEIIVVNDSAVSEINVPSAYSMVKVLRNPGSGVASARNYGASKASSGLLWFIDDDIWIGKNILSHALELHKQFPSAVFNFNWEYPPALLEDIRKFPFGRYLEHIEFTTMKGWCRGFPWKDNDLFKTDWLAGATLLIPAEIYSKVGGYDASFPLAGFEDHDFSVRLAKLKIDSYIDTRVTALHNEINKTSLKGYLQRTYNNAITRKHAVSIGYADQQIQFTFSRKIIYKILNVCQPLMIKITEIWPETNSLDSMYFKLCNALIGLNIYKGYSGIK